MNKLMPAMIAFSTAVLFGCQSNNESDTTEGDKETASDEQSSDSTGDTTSDEPESDPSSDTEADTLTDSDTALNWNNFDLICYAPDCSNDTCRGFGADECPDCPLPSAIEDLDLLDDTTGFTAEYVCYYPPGCGGSECTRMVNSDDVTGWTCTMRPC
jgi:hypothetical protein